MKKTYVKPELFFEQFILNQHMARECMLDWDNHTDPYVCTASGSAEYHMEDVTVFQTVEACRMIEGTPEAYCYFPSTNTYAVFGSGG